MEMHTRQSLFEVHGISIINGVPVVPRRRSSHWSRKILRWLALKVVSLTWEIRARRAVRELASMNDYTLRDIGISRSHIDYVVRHGRRDLTGE